MFFFQIKKEKAEQNFLWDIFCCCLPALFLCYLCRLLLASAGSHTLLLDYYYHRSQPSRVSCGSPTPAFSILLTRAARPVRGIFAKFQRRWRLFLGDGAAVDQMDRQAPAPSPRHGAPAWGVVLFTKESGLGRRRLLSML